MQNSLQLRLLKATILFVTILNVNSKMAPSPRPTRSLGEGNMPTHIPKITIFCIGCRRVALYNHRHKRIIGESDKEEKIGEKSKKDFATGTMVS